MFTAECGCIFRTPYSIPPERPCDEATRLLDELAARGLYSTNALAMKQRGMYWDAKRYMSHMKEAWNTLEAMIELIEGDSKWFEQ